MVGKGISVSARSEDTGREDSAEKETTKLVGNDGI